MSKKQVEAQVVRPTRRVAALLGFLLKGEVDAIFKQRPYQTVAGKDPLDLWREQDRRRQEMSSVPIGKPCGLPEELLKTIEQIKTRKTYKKTYEGMADFEFALIPIESLISPQWEADL